MAQTKRAGKAAQHKQQLNPHSMWSKIPQADGDSGSATTTSNCYRWLTLPEFVSRHDNVPRPGTRKGAEGTGEVSIDCQRVACTTSGLRHRLCTHKAGDLWFPAGGIAKEETDIPPVITVLPVEYAGTGKSSLVNPMYSVLGRSGFVLFAQTLSFFACRQVLL